MSLTLKNLSYLDLKAYSDLISDAPRPGNEQHLLYSLPDDPDQLEYIIGAAARIVTRYMDNNKPVDDFLICNEISYIFARFKYTLKIGINTDGENSFIENCLESHTVLFDYYFSLVSDNEGSARSTSVSDVPTATSSGISDGPNAVPVTVQHEHFEQDLDDDSSDVLVTVQETDPKQNCDANISNSFVPYICEPPTELAHENIVAVCSMNHTTISVSSIGEHLFCSEPNCDVCMAAKLLAVKSLNTTFKTAKPLPSISSKRQPNPASGNSKAKRRRLQRKRQIDKIKQMTTYVKPKLLKHAAQPIMIGDRVIQVHTNFSVDYVSGFRLGEVLENFNREKLDFESEGDLSRESDDNNYTRLS